MVVGWLALGRHIVLHHITSLIVGPLADKDHIMIKMQRHDVFVVIRGDKAWTYEFRMVQSVHQPLEHAHTAGRCVQIVTVASKLRPVGGLRILYNIESLVREHGKEDFKA